MLLGLTIRVTSAHHARGPDRTVQPAVTDNPQRLGHVGRSVI